MIAREGIIFIVIGLVLTIGFLLTSVRYDNKLLFTLAVISCLLTLFTTFFFRDPDRSFTKTEGILISPADGKILAVENVGHHEFIGGEAVKISIFLSVFDVHVNRIPADGVIDYVKYNPGEFHAAWADKASDKNEQTEIGMTTTAGHKIIFKQIAGLIARRIICRLSAADTVTAGKRFGLIRFGSRTELFVPADSKILVKPGDHVAGSETIFGYLPKIIIDDRPMSESQENVEP